MNYQKVPKTFAQKYKKFLFIMPFLLFYVMNLNAIIQSKDSEKFFSSVIAFSTGPITMPKAFVACFYSKEINHLYQIVVKQLAIQSSSTDTEKKIVQHYSSIAR